MSSAQVGEWLAQEGFGDAKKAFGANDVDGLALLDLNEARADARATSLREAV